MPDWKKIVREKLGTLPLTNGRRDEVIEELAQQLESAYEEALAQGVNEQEAMRRSLAQFKDWEKLRMELFQSVEDCPCADLVSLSRACFPPGLGDSSCSRHGSHFLEFSSFLPKGASPHRAVRRQAKICPRARLRCYAQPQRKQRARSSSRRKSHRAGFKPYLDRREDLSCQRRLASMSQHLPCWTMGPRLRGDDIADILCAV